VKDTVYEYYQQKALQGDILVNQWMTLLQAYSEQYPELSNEFQRRIYNHLPSNDWKEALPRYNATTEVKAAATRNRSEEILNILAQYFPEIVGGSADLTPSNLTFLKVSKVHTLFTILVLMMMIIIIIMIDA
jgi:transketolase